MWTARNTDGRVLERFSTLISDNPLSVYTFNRGAFVMHAFQMLCDWQYHALESLRETGAISKIGFERMVEVPHDRMVVDGGKGGPWIGVRTLLDIEVINSSAVATFVLREIRNGRPAVMGLVFLPLIAPGVFRDLNDCRAYLRRKLGWLGRSLCASPFGRYTRPQSSFLLSTLDEILDRSVGEYFDHYHNQLLSSDDMSQVVAAVTMNTFWLAFNATYPDLESFRNASASEQAVYLRKLPELIKQTSSNAFTGMSTAPVATSLGTAISQIYLISVAANNVAEIKRMAAALEPFNKMANDVLEAARSSPR